VLGSESDGFGLEAVELSRLGSVEGRNTLDLNEHLVDLGLHADCHFILHLQVALCPHQLLIGALDPFLEVTGDAVVPLEFIDLLSVRAVQGAGTRLEGVEFVLLRLGLFRT
jgi:hypothetical protein